MFKEPLPCRNVVKSLAKAASLTSVLSILMPLMQGSFRILIRRSSKAIMKRYGDKGSPSLTRLSTLNIGDEKPLFVTQLDMM